MKAGVKKLVVLEGVGYELLQLLIEMSPEEREKYGGRIRRQILRDPDEILKVIFTREEWNDISEIVQKFGL